MRISRAVSVLFLFLALPLRAAELTHTEALVTLCKVWSTAKFLHPRLMVRELDWDGALLRAIPAAREAKTHDELANAIRGARRPLVAGSTGEAGRVTNAA
ncbi:MAG: hypothetical protein HYU52_09990 [Acidobacteria bacterium]|nr:hypothetical protein [Acidobacteriota bacterium]